jgi:small subunit ribosomal protein S17
MTTENKTIKRTFLGKVVGISMDKTARVEVVSLKMHPKYKKSYKTSKKYLVHDEKNQAKVGETVSFEECRPYSKTKRWRLVLSK